MKRESFCYLAAAALCAAGLLAPGQTEARDRNLSVSLNGEPENCSAVSVRSSDAVARAEEAFSEPVGSTLAIAGANHGNIHVHGWNQPGYSIQVCKIAVGADGAAADRDLKTIAVSHTSARYSVSGPASETDWLVYFIVHAPQGASLDLETKNQPISVAEVSGTIKARAVNGPVSIKGSQGHIQAHAVNGPVSFAGESGDVTLSTQNGPMSIQLSGTAWNGQQMEARTINGPLNLHVPDAYRSGVRVETSGHAPIMCKGAICAGVVNAQGRRTFELNGGNPVVRLSTDNGPVSVRSGKGNTVMI